MQKFHFQLNMNIWFMKNGYTLMNGVNLRDFFIVWMLQLGYFIHDTLLPISICMVLYAGKGEFIIGVTCNVS